MKNKKHVYESEAHKELKIIARKKLKKLGCSKICEEFSYPSSNKTYIFDVVGFKDKKMFIVECGNINSKGMLKFIKKMKNVKFIHLKFEDYPHLSKSRYKNKNITITKEQARYVKENCISLSHFTQGKLDELMSK